VAPTHANLTAARDCHASGVVPRGTVGTAAAFPGHAWCQSAIVLLNLAVIVLTMLPSFRLLVILKIPLKLGKT
jgi:hypothetical protein